MAGKKRKGGIRRPVFQDKANGVIRVVLPQVWVEPWRRARLEVATERMACSMAEFIREAVSEKMDRVLGPLKPELARTGQNRE